MLLRMSSVAVKVCFASPPLPPFLPPFLPEVIKTGLSYLTKLDAAIVLSLAARKRAYQSSTKVACRQVDDTHNLQRVYMQAADTLYA